MRKQLLAAALLLLASGASMRAGSSRASESPRATSGADIFEQVLVKVNGDIITKTELEQRQVAVLRQKMQGQVDPASLKNDETLKKQAAGFKVYKSSEPFGPNRLYVVFLEPTVPASEYELFNMLLRTMTPEEQRAEGAQEMWKRYADAFAAGLNKLSLVPLGGA